MSQVVGSQEESQGLKEQVRGAAMAKAGHPQAGSLQLGKRLGKTGEKEAQTAWVSGVALQVGQK
jgi:hypothetical protein